ncbi:MAG: Kae1-associated kinase Bud32 [Thermoprotei archaeon]|nr:MAG: Kae1-associated kinase Bud32 [Thermoprotei archaeon]
MESRRGRSSVVKELLEFVEEGAEAVVFTGYMLGNKVIVKQRIRKPYRDQRFDEIFRYTRTKTEAKILAELFLKGLNVPAPLIVDIDKYLIVMEYIEGRKLVDIINETSENKIAKIATELGVQVGKMHSQNIYHGDLTLGNIILSVDGHVYLIDFGLAGYSRDIEEYAIDLHLLRRSLMAIVPEKFEVFFGNFLLGYRNGYPQKYQEVINRLEEIKLRGRYVEERLKKIRGERYSE